MVNVDCYGQSLTLFPSRWMPSVGRNRPADQALSREMILDRAPVIGFVESACSLSAPWLARPKWACRL